VESEAAAAPSAIAKLGDEPRQAVADFASMSRDACAACHTPRAAGDSCVQCHRYHAGEPPLTSRLSSTLRKWAGQPRPSLVGAMRARKLRMLELMPQLHAGSVDVVGVLQPTVHGVCP
jgi:hypothetical protein